MPEKDKVPGHVGIIMDGNGRWAETRGLPRVEGHRRGAERAKEIARTASKAGVKVLTLYAFSLENWQRPRAEISTLMKLIEYYLKNELASLVSEGIVFKTIGETWRLPESIQQILRETEERTSGSSGMTLVSALSYGGRNEILRAVKKALSNGASAGELTEEGFSELLDTKGIPPVDLIIRTSGERRISNFLIWQSAYSEFYFTDTLWPDFTPEEFHAALKDYRQRERRFGSVPERLT